MPKEIERKFLVRRKKLALDFQQGGGTHIIQGYLSTGPTTVRVRLSDDARSPRGWLTVKGPGKLERDEFEYSIPPQDAREMLALCEFKLEKVRREITIGSHVWEVDEFLGPHSPLWMAEVELQSADEAFELPSWAGEEVTQDSRFANAKMAKAGRCP